MVIKLKSQRETERPFNLLSWGHWFTFANLILALLFSSFYAVDYSMPESFLGWFYLFVTWIGHFAFLALSCFILTIFPVIVLFPYKRHIRGVSAVMASIFQLYLFLDVLAYRGLGYHLSSSSFKQLREVEDVYLAMMGDSYFVMVLGIFVFILAYQFLVSNLTWKRIHQLQAFKYKKALSSSLIGAFFFSHFVHIWGDATLNADIAKQASMFPAHYPLTAKTLLARYELIDLQEHQNNQSKQAFVGDNDYQLVPSHTPTCEIDDKPMLNVIMLPQESEQLTLNWLSQNNVQFEQSNQLNVPTDMSALLFNFKSGLPGLYESYADQVLINSLFAKPVISVQMLSEAFEAHMLNSKPSNKKVFVFYKDKSQTEQVFYRTNSIFVGFENIPQTAFSPQNIIATYLAKGLDCTDFVDKNLIDKPFEQVDSTHITTHFTDGFFQFVYKDNALLFKNGKLVSNTTYSTNKEVDATVDITLVEDAVSNLTKRRKKINDE